MKRLTAKKKKAKPVYSRRLGTGFAAAPTDDFWKFKDYVRMEIDKKDYTKAIKEYIKKSFSKSDAKIMISCPDWCFTTKFHIAATIVWHNLEHKIPAKWNHVPMFKDYFGYLLEKGKETIKEKSKNDAKIKVGRSPMDIVKQRTSDFIAELEEILDTWTNGSWSDVEKFSTYDELLKINAPYNTAKAVYDYYLPLKGELDELLKKKTKDLVEAYSHMTLKRKKEYHKLVSEMVLDAERFMMRKKAKRVTKVPKKQTADKQIKNLKYLKDSKEHKLTSISPINIPQSRRLYVFNVKNRKLIEFVSYGSDGLEVKGSTLTKVDLENSRQVTLRNPDEFLSIVMKKTPNMINKEWAKLTTKTTLPTARINKDMILLRSLDK